MSNGKIHGSGGHLEHLMLRDAPITDTPRVDAACFDYLPGVYVVDADFARTLEREIGEWKKWCAYVLKAHPELQDQGGQKPGYTATL